MRGFFYDVIRHIFKLFFWLKIHEELFVHTAFNFSAQFVWGK